MHDGGVIHMNPAGGLSANKSRDDFGKSERNLNDSPMSLTILLTPDLSCSRSSSLLAHSNNFYGQSMNQVASGCNKKGEKEERR